MALEKVKILKTEKIISKRDGKEHNFLRVEITLNTSIYLQGDALLQMGAYDNHQGQVVGMHLNWSLRDGKPQLSIHNDPSLTLFASEKPVSNQSDNSTSFADKFRKSA